MTTARRLLRGVSFVSLACVTVATTAQAQTSSDAQGPGREVTGIVAGFGLVGEGFAPDALWGIKVAGFPGKRFGGEFTFHQSVREPGFRYMGGDFVVQFPKPDFKGLIPFAHLGAGAFLFGWSDAVPAWSFGGGIKQYITERVGVRVGVQDRKAIQYPIAHLFDFYGGAIIRF